MGDNNCLSCKVYYFVHKKLVLSNELTKVKLPPRKNFKIFHGGNSTSINSFDKTKFLFHSPTEAVPQFL